MEIIQVYTDASVNQKSNIFGMGACILIGDDEEVHLMYSKTTKSYKKLIFNKNSLNDKDINKLNKLKFDIVGAEYLAVLNTLRYILNNNIRGSIQLYVDNCNVFRTINKLSKHNNKYKYFIDEILRTFNQLKCDVDVRKIKSHSQIYGNNIADNCAKKAIIKQTKNGLIKKDLIC